MYPSDGSVSAGFSTAAISPLFDIDRDMPTRVTLTTAGPNVCVYSDAIEVPPRSVGDLLGQERVRLFDVGVVVQRRVALKLPRSPTACDRSWPSA